MAESIPRELEERIAFYEDPRNDPGPLRGPDWTVLIATGIVLPLVCIILGWFVGWPA